MRKVVTMVLALAILAGVLIGCGGKQLCPTCGVAAPPLTEDQIRYNKEIGL
jgi:hypothetical protein